MSIINVELYSIVLLVILLTDYLIKFFKRYTKASLIWLCLALSTLLISISNICFVLSNLYVIKLISIITYLLFTLLSSLCVYVYIKYIYIKQKINLKKESILIICSLIICVLISLTITFGFKSSYILHSLDWEYFNKLLILAIIPNISMLLIYFIHIIKNKIEINYKIIFTLIITIIGLIFDIKYDTLFFVSATFTITTLILYMNKNEKLLNTDPLTGLVNKRGLESFLLGLKQETTVAVYNVDIDKFKIINDKYGHLQGDIVLQNVASVLRSSSRNRDLVVRNGGDEFLIIADINQKKDAKKLIKRINANIDFYNSKSEIKISISIGWGLYNHKIENSLEDFLEFLKIIDKDMYLQKKKHHKKK